MKKKVAFFVLNMAVSALSLPARLLKRSTNLSELRPKKILIIRLDYIGDVVMTSPAFSFLRSKFPEASISLLTNGVARDLYKSDSNLDKIWVYNWPWRLLRKDNGFNRAKVRELFHLVRSLRKERFDLVVDSRGDTRFLLLFGVLVGAKTKIGNSRSGKTGVLDFTALHDPDKHEVERSFDALRCFGNGPTELQPYINLTDNEIEKATGLVKSLNTEGRKKVALIAPYSSKDVKSWPMEYFEEVISHLLTENYLVLVAGTKDDVESAYRLTGAFVKNVYSLAGKTSIVELAALTSVCQLVVGVDTGVLHIASCFKTPIVAIFGPTRACEYRPYSKQSVVADNQSCACDQLTHAKCDIPVGDYAKCMFELTPGAVVAAIDRIQPA